jgi:hypothetical protein
MTITEVSLKALELIARAHELNPLLVETEVTYGFSTSGGRQRHYTINVYDCLRFNQRLRVAHLQVSTSPSVEELGQMIEQLEGMDAVLKGFCSERSEREAMVKRKEELIGSLSLEDRWLLGIS